MSSDTSKFHKTKQSAAVLKHAVLHSYITPFASKTGSTSRGNRVAFIDGYAGPGRYDDGTEGSGAMLLRKARELAAFPRQVECHFVEHDADTAAKLRAVADAEAEGQVFSVTDGDISEHLPKLLERCQDVPLFVYLDPCGLPIPMDEVATIFDRPFGLGAPATEVLINLTAGLRRVAGVLYSESPNETTLKRMDGVCGGSWWRDAWLEKCPSKHASEGQKMAAELAVVEGYAARLREHDGAIGTWIIDVKPRANLKPVYYLVFATRSIHGMTTFGESTSKALERWREYIAEQDAEDDLFGSAADWAKAWKDEEKKLKNEWIDKLTARLIAELDKGQPFTIMERADEILGDDLVGVVRGMHLRAAINNARAAGKTRTDPKGLRQEGLYELTLTPA